MIKHQIAKGLVQYQFDPEPGMYFANNITAVMSEKGVLLLDTAYETQALEVLDDLAIKGFTIESIVITHFHGDHMYGLKALPKVPVYGSSAFQETLNLWYPQEVHPLYTPTILVEGEQRIQFGDRQLTLIPFPGHSQCSMLVLIDDTYLHVADELMFSNAGEPILPSVDNRQTVLRHYESLERLKAYTHYTLIPGHGKVITGKEQIENDIQNRICYFQAVLESDRELSYEEAIKDCNCTFLHSEWHTGVNA